MIMYFLLQDMTSGQGDIDGGYAWVILAGKQLIYCMEDNVNMNQILTSRHEGIDGGYVVWVLL